MNQIVQNSHITLLKRCDDKLPTMQQVANNVHADHYKGTINGVILSGVIPGYGGEPSIFMNTKSDVEWQKWVGVMINAARQVNDEWEADFNDDQQDKWYFAYSNGKLTLEVAYKATSGEVFFKSQFAAVEALVMLNEWSIQQGLGQDGIVLRALGVVKGGI